MYEVSSSVRNSTDYLGDINYKNYEAQQIWMISISPKIYEVKFSVPGKYSNIDIKIVTMMFIAYAFSSNVWEKNVT